jgi:hypothetical protein
MWGCYRSKVMGMYSEPFSRASCPTHDFFWWYMFFIYGRLCPICFLSWVLLAPYLCLRFYIFDIPILEEWFSS